MNIENEDASTGEGSDKGSGCCGEDTADTGEGEGRTEDTHIGGAAEESGCCGDGVTAQKSTGDLRFEGRSGNRKRLWWMVGGAGVIVGVFIGLILVSGSAGDCIDRTLSSTACNDAAWGQVLNEVGDTRIDVNDGLSPDEILLVAEQCSNATMDLALVNDKVLCVGSVDGATWSEPQDLQSFVVGSCVSVTEDQLKVPQTVTCDVENSLLIRAVVALDPFESPVDVGTLTAYRDAAVGACAYGASLGLSLFEWMGGGETLLCVVAS